MDENRGYRLGLRLLTVLVGIALLGVSARPRAADLALQGARRAWESGNPLEASRQLARAAEHFPWRSDLWELAGVYAVQGGAQRQALFYLAQAAARGPLSPAGQIARGDAYQALGDLPAAITAWQAALPAAQAHPRLAQAYRQQGRYTEALENLQALLITQPSDAAAYYQAGLLLAALRPESCIAYLTRAAELNPSLAATASEMERRIRTARLADEPAYTFMSTGRVLASLGEWDLAAEAFRQAVALRPDYAEAWAYWGEARQHTTPGADANGLILADLEKAHQLAPHSLAANLFLALYWRRQGNYEQAFVYLNTAAQAEPTNPVVQVEMGNTRSEQGDLLAAQAHFLRALELAPEEVVYWRILAQFSLQHQIQIRQLALYAARQAVTLAPQDPISLDLMGYTLLLLEDYANAERFLRRALAANPNYALAHLHLGQVYLFTGDSQRAHDHLLIAQALAPSTPTADLAQRLLQRYFP